ncbi:hypothetical protein AALO_G00223100 [Alosa alosa]|uniref:Uncharacterized protein n=1 Tax=Alosa alosa TaxID=278164 RepID=A0AAV6G2G7_9TELE|nr:hypothetical protein AALO_G00223100 [Alosa alosa]
MDTQGQYYVVARPIHSEESFQETYEKIYRRRKTLLDHVTDYLTCDSKRAKNAALSLMPIIGWLRIYRLKEWLLNDIVSGVSTGLVAVLQVNPKIRREWIVKIRRDIGPHFQVRYSSLGTNVNVSYNN